MKSDVAFISDSFKSILEILTLLFSNDKQIVSADAKSRYRDLKFVEINRQTFVISLIVAKIKVVCTRR